MEKFKAQINRLITIKENDTLRVVGHGFNIENLGNTIVRISGYNSLKPKGYIIAPNYSDIRVYRDEHLTVIFDASELQTGEVPRNEIVIHVDRITPFNYD